MDFYLIGNPRALCNNNYEKNSTKPLNKQSTDFLKALIFPSNQKSLNLY